jgi:hypothetical protein
VWAVAVGDAVAYLLVQWRLSWTADSLEPREAASAARRLEPVFPLD